VLGGTAWVATRINHEQKAAMAMWQARAEHQICKREQPVVVGWGRYQQVVVVVVVGGAETTSVAGAGSS